MPLPNFTFPQRGVSELARFIPAHLPVRTRHARRMYFHIGEVDREPVRRQQIDSNQSLHLATQTAEITAKSGHPNGNQFDGFDLRSISDLASPNPERSNHFVARIGANVEGVFPSVHVNSGVS